MSIKTRFADFKATKTTLFWTSVGVSALTMIVGFSALGWMTEGKAEELRQAAVDEVRFEFASSSCVQNFLASADPAAEQAELKAVQSFKREKHLDAKGWLSAELAGNKKVERRVAKECAAQILKAEL